MNQWGQTRLIPALEMDVLRCKSQHMVDKEIAVYFLAYNLVRWAGCGGLARGRIATGIELYRCQAPVERIRRSASSNIGRSSSHPDRECNCQHRDTAFAIPT